MQTKKPELTENGNKVLSVFSKMSSHDPEGAKMAIDEAWDLIVSASGTTKENLLKAMDMVAEEGFNGGPAYHDDYPEQFGVDFSFADALKYVRFAMMAEDDIGDVEWLNPEYDYYEDEVKGPQPNSKIEASEIIKEIFGFYFQIYGNKR